MRLPSPTTAFAFLTSVGLHGGMLAFALSGGAQQGLPDGQVILTVDIISQEQAAAQTRTEADNPVLAPREDSRRPEIQEAAGEDRQPAVPGDVPANATPAKEARVIGSDQSSFVVAQGLDDPDVVKPTVVPDEPIKSKTPKAGAKPAPVGPKARRKAAPNAKTDVTRAESKASANAAPEAPPSPGEDVARKASAGSPGRNAPFFPPSMRDGLIGLLQQQIERCYTTPAGASKRIVLPIIGIRLERSGRLMDAPRIVRSGKTPVDMALARAALAAVQRCAPYRIPPLYAPYYDAWRDIAAEFEFSGS